MHRRKIAVHDLFLDSYQTALYFSQSIFFNPFTKNIRLIRFLFLLCITVIGAAGQPLFERYTVEQGLSQNLVMSIAEDRHGFLWFGTKDGLNRFDGYSFRVFRNSINDTSTLSANYITSLHIDSTQTLWIGTSGGGLNRFNEETETFTSFRKVEKDRTSIPSNYVFKIISGWNGKLFVATIDGGVCSFDPTTNVFTRILFDSTEITLPYSSMVSSLFLGRDSTLWISTLSKGIFAYNFHTGKREHIFCTHTKFGLTENVAKNIFEDSRRRIWIANDHGFDILDRSTGIAANHRIIQNHDTLPGVAVQELSDGRFFINVFSNQGYYDPVTRKFQPLGITLSTKTYFDHSGMLWVSTGGYGIIKYNPLLERFHRRPGPFAFERFEEEFSEIQKSNSITANVRTVDKYTVVRDFSGTLWFWEKRNRRLDAYNTFTKKLTVFTPEDLKEGIKIHEPQRVFAVNDSSVWITFGSALARFDSLKKKFITYNLAEYAENPSLLKNSTEYAFLTAIHRGKNNIVWIGTTNAGLIKFDEQKGRVEFFRSVVNDSTTLTNNYVLTILDDPNDPAVLWIGTDGGGLNRFDTRTNIVTHRFTASNGIPNDVIYGILSDKQKYLWMSCNSGIFSFDPLTMKVTARYDAHDGLQSSEFNRYEFWKDETGKMYFGGIEGWNSFYPESIYTRTYVPPIVFADIKVQNQSIVFSNTLQHSTAKPQKPVTLHPDQNIITFEFASLDYAAPNKNKYAYMLEGFDNGWNYSGTNRTATYTNLDPGSYTFRVKGTNGDGVWNERGTSIQIIVLPPYYKTWWFRGGVLVIVIGSLIVIVRRRFTILRREQQWQEEFSRQLLEQQEQDRERIAAELHDSLGQNLLVVKNRAVLGARNAEEQHQSKDHFDFISSIISDTLKEVREISHNLRPYQLDRLGLSDALHSTVQKVSESSSIIVEREIDDVDNVFTKEKEINIYRIVQESLNNILKHSHATKAKLAVKINHNVVFITVEDNGRGFSFADNKNGKGFGMRGMNERVRILNGTMSYHTEPGKGTKLEFEIPFSKNERL